MGNATFWEGTLAPDTTFEAGEVFCQRVRAQVPAAFSAGSGESGWDGAVYDLSLEVAAPSGEGLYSLPVAAVTVGP